MSTILFFYFSQSGIFSVVLHPAVSPFLGGTVFTFFGTFLVGSTVFCSHNTRLSPTRSASGFSVFFSSFVSTTGGVISSCRELTSQSGNLSSSEFMIFP